MLKLTDAPQVINADTPESHYPDILRKVLAGVAHLRGFLVWRGVPRGNRVEKLPVDPETGQIPSRANSTRERAVLTLQEALQAAARHALGVGCAPGRLGIVAADFDNALSIRDVLRESLAQVIGTPAECYTERSPSGTGLRGLLLGQLPAGIGNGREIGSTGFYFDDTRFVTLTGNRYAGPLEIVTAQGVIDRGAERMRLLAASHDARGMLMPYSGAEGERIALEHIRTGAAMHEPLMHLGFRWARTRPLDMQLGGSHIAEMMPLHQSEVQAKLYALMDESEVKTTDPARWSERRSNIGRWTSGAFRKALGSDHRRLGPPPDYRAAMDSLQELVRNPRKIDTTEPSDDLPLGETPKETLRLWLGMINPRNEAAALEVFELFDLTYPSWSKPQWYHDLEAPYRVDQTRTEKPKPPVVKAYTPDFSIPTADLPTRPWVIDRFALRGFQSMLIGMPGVSKTMFFIALALHMAAGRKFGDLTPTKGEKLSVLMVLTEEDRTEIDLRVRAVMEHFSITGSELGNRLAIIPIEEARGFSIALDQNETEEDAIDRMVATIQAYRSDVVLVDTFAKIHNAEENDNSEMRHVGRNMTMVAQRANVAIVSTIHTPKITDVAGNMWAARGASAVVGEAKVMQTLATMEEVTADLLGISRDARTNYARRDDAKTNAYRLGNTQWYERISVTLANGESVGVLNPVSMEDPTNQITERMLTDYQKHIQWTTQQPDKSKLVQTGRNRLHAGAHLSQFLAGYDLEIAPHRCAKVISEWIAADFLRTGDRTITKGKARTVLLPSEKGSDAE